MASPTPQYRDAVPIPREVREHCDVYFDEKLCMALVPLIGIPDWR